MKKIYLFLFLLLLCGTSEVYGQEDLFFEGTVKDSAMNPLPDVRVYYRDTVPIYNDRDGKFRIRMKHGDKLHFRKSGYVWHTEIITEKSTGVIILAPTQSAMIKKRFGGGKYSPTYSPEYTDIIFDDKPVRFEEWLDAFAMHRSELVSLSIRKGKFDDENGKTIVRKKTEITIKSIFQWNKDAN
jgi:hypothetical protein